MRSRIARIALVLGISLVVAGVASEMRSGLRFVEALERVDERARIWGMLGLSLCAVVLLSAIARGVIRLFRGGRRAWGSLAAFGWLILAVNLLFWGLIAAQIAPVQRLYEKGRIVWVGEKAFLFAHGYWEISDGYWEHQTVVKLAGGRLYRGPTLNLLLQLRRRGATSVWGSWCFTGDYPYIRKDLVSGRQVPWPSYASYNTTPGVTIPIWLGSTFVRLGWPKDRYGEEPPSIGAFTPDTLVLMNPSAHHVEQAFTLVQQRVSNRLPRPDSVSWYPLAPDTVYGLSWSTLRALSPDERRRAHAEERAALKSKSRTGLALFWIRGRAFPMHIRIPPRFRRPPDPPGYEVVQNRAGPR